MRTQELTNGEIVELCLANGVTTTRPFSQLEAEASRRGVDVVVVIREHLLGRLREMGVL